MKDKDNNSGRNSAVGNIKCGPMQVPDIKIKKIDHRSEADTIDQIADGPAEDQRKGSCQPWIIGRCFFIKIKNQTHGQRRYKKKDKTPQSRAQVGHQTKGSARVENMGDVKKTIQNGYDLVQRHVADDQHFAELIKQNNNAGKHEQFYVFILQHIIEKVQRFKGSGFLPVAAGCF